MKIMKKLFSLVFALMFTFALCSCVQGNITGTGGISESTGGSTSATTQGGAENTGFTLPAPTVKGYLHIIDQTVFYGKVAIDGKIETKMMRVAVLSAEKILNQTITYIDVIDDDGTVLASTMMGGYGFLAISTDENTATAILRYSIDLVGDRFTLATTMGEFRNIGVDGKPMGKLSFITYTNKNVAVNSSDDGIIFAEDQIVDFSRGAADLIEGSEHKWTIMALCANSGYTKGNYTDEPPLSEVIAKIRSLNGEALKKIAAQYREMEEKRVELAEKSEKMLNAILAGNSDVAIEIIEGVTEENKEQLKVEEWISELRAKLKGVESFKLENYWRARYNIDGEIIYSYAFKMTTEKGIFRVEVLQKMGEEKLRSFYIAKQDMLLWESPPKLIE